MPLLAAAAGQPYWTDPTFWVGVALAVLLAAALWMGVPAMLAKTLDDRAAAIKSELDEAKRLKEEAQKLLEDYKGKHAEAENEAKAILDAAKREAEALAAETRKSLKETLERRTKLAEEKIARAEAQAIGEVRAAAVDAAIAAAEKLVGEKAQGAALIDQSIKDLGSRLN